MTPTFTDSKGRKWELEFNVWVCRKLKRELGFEFSALQAGDGWARIATNMELFGALLWLLCESQADERKIEPEEFGESITGAIIDEAQDALATAVAKFSPPQLRSAVENAIKKSNETLTAGANTAAEMLANTDIEKAVSDSIKKAIAEG